MKNIGRVGFSPWFLCSTRAQRKMITGKSQPEMRARESNKCRGGKHRRTYIRCSKGSQFSCQTFEICLRKKWNESWTMYAAASLFIWQAENNAGWLFYINSPIFSGLSCHQYLNVLIARGEITLFFLIFKFSITLGTQLKIYCKT